MAALIALRVQDLLELPIALFIIALTPRGRSDALRGTLAPGRSGTGARLDAVHPTPLASQELACCPSSAATRPNRSRRPSSGSRQPWSRLGRRDRRTVPSDPRNARAGVRGGQGGRLGRGGPRAARLCRRASRRQPEYRGSRRPSRWARWRGPRIGILAEYDALPGLGHGCGHNTMAASGVGAAIALASIADELPGEIVFLGTPAEERGSGKGIMIEDGLFDGIDAALLYHPCDRSHVESHPLASEDVDVDVHRPPGPRLVRSRGRAGTRSTRMISLFVVGRPVAAAAPTDGARPRDHPRGRHGRQHHPGPDRRPGS